MRACFDSVSFCSDFAGLHARECVNCSPYHRSFSAVSIHSWSVPFHEGICVERRGYIWMVSGFRRGWGCLPARNDFSETRQAPILKTPYEGSFKPIFAVFHRRLCANIDYIVYVLRSSIPVAATALVLHTRQKRAIQQNSSFMTTSKVYPKIRP